MTSQVNTPIDFSNEQVVSLIENDEHLRTLPLDSDDLKAAVNEKLTQKDENIVSADDDGNEEDGANSDEHSDEDADDDQPKKKPQRGILRRIEKLVVEKHDLSKKVAHLEAQLRQSVETQVEEAVGEFQFDEPAPVFAKFDTLDEYIDARAEWMMRKADAEKEHKAQVSDLEKQVQDTATRWTSLEVEAKKEFADYSEVVTVESVTAANPSQIAKEYLAESDIGPKVVYTLFSDEDLYEEFAKSSAARQVKILTRIERNLEEADDAPAEQKKPTTEKKSKLPTPLPRGKSSTSSLDLIQDADKMSDEEWSKAYEAQRRRR